MLQKVNMTVYLSRLGTYCYIVNGLVYSCLFFISQSVSLAVCKLDAIIVFVQYLILLHSSNMSKTSSEKSLYLRLKDKKQDFYFKMLSLDYKLHISVLAQAETSHTYFISCMVSLSCMTRTSAGTEASVSELFLSSRLFKVLLALTAAHRSSTQASVILVISTLRQTRNQNECNVI